MRDYLIMFCDEFEYPNEAKSALLSVYDKMCEDELFIENLNIYDRSIDIDSALADMQIISEKYNLEKYTLDLVFCICLSHHTRVLYKQQSFSENVFHSTFLDFKYKLFECYAIYGIWGTFVAWWFSRHLNLTLFGLGRLQYEVMPLKYNYNGLIKGKNVLSVHIPSSGPLIHDECAKSYRMAAKFFENEFSDGKAVFICDSWLLFPMHYNVLQKDSNILKFMDDFDIIKSVPDPECSNLWRIFGKKYDNNIDSLPADTELRRAYINLLKSGMKPENGYGIFVLNIL